MTANNLENNTGKKADFYLTKLLTEPIIDIKQNNFTIFNLKNHLSSNLLSELFNPKNPIIKLIPCERTMIMDAVINHNFSILENIYNKDKDLLPFFYDRSGYHSLISLIPQIDYARHLCKNFFIKIIKDAKNIPIEPPEIPGKLQAGVCHWICEYGDVDVAKLLFLRNDIIINRFNAENKLGPAYLTEKKDKCVTEILLLAIENGLDINKRYDLHSPTLLECFTD